MTVGIGYGNKECAVCLTDERISYGSRQSDSVNKLGIFKREGSHHGVVFGAGNAEYVFGVVETPLCEDSLEEIATHVHEIWEARFEKDLQDYRTRLTSDRDSDVEVITDSDKRAKFIDQKTDEILAQLQSLRGGLSTGGYIVGYDIQAGRIRKYQMNLAQSEEIQRPSIQIGSGADGANWYMSLFSQGVNVEQQSPEDLVFTALNAYSFSTANVGVGGTPKIALIDKDDVKLVDQDKAAALANVCAAHLAGIIDKQTATDYFNTIYGVRNGDLKGDGNVEEIAEQLHLKPEMFSGTAIPLGTFIQLLNR